MIGVLRSIKNFLMPNWYFPDMRITDIIEIVIIAVLIYRLILWIKNTKAWMLLKGLAVLAGFIFLATIFRMYTFLWIAQNILPFLATALIIIFQPELRRALEKLGEKQIIDLNSIYKKEVESARFTERTIDALVRAAFEMGKVKTGALIVVEQAIMLTEYESTGIDLDCIVSREVLINIFEHNTPLHDGAILIRNDRIVAATCYLPLSDNMSISKDLGTRHRAALGMSEVSDALVIAVSEETGHVSVASGGKLVRNVTPEFLRDKLEVIQNKKVEPVGINALMKGWRKNAETNNE